MKVVGMGSSRVVWLGIGLVNSKSKRDLPGPARERPGVVSLMSRSVSL